MTKIEQIIIITLLLITYSTNAQNIITGSEKTGDYLTLLEGKKVGLVVNQTSLIEHIHIVDSLMALKIDVVKVFSPEHGFRGLASAGEKVEDGIDLKSRLPIISLYGSKSRKPNSEQLNNIEILLFDIQDVGVRFYTYISTLHYVMEAAAENNIPVIILDRPNPNGHYIDGPLRKEKFKSFVGMHPIPIVHGMTIGEYAKMINGENWISKKCELKVIKMDNYYRNYFYELPVKPSPNLPNKIAINLYPSLCLFEGTNVSIGRGTNFPFQQFGAPYIESKYSFIPNANKGSKKPKHLNTKCFGTDLRKHNGRLNEINLEWLIDTYNSSPKKEEFFNNFFDKLAGTDQLRNQIIAGNSSEEIKNNWQLDLENFKKLRSKYLLY